MIRRKALPWLLGVAVLAFSLVAALRSADTPVNTGAGGGRPADPPPPNGPTILGVVGTVGAAVLAWWLKPKVDPTVNPTPPMVPGDLLQKLLEALQAALKPPAPTPPA